MKSGPKKVTLDGEIVTRQKQVKHLCESSIVALNVLNYNNFEVFSSVHKKYCNISSVKAYQNTRFKNEKNSQNILKMFTNEAFLNFGIWRFQKSV